MNTWSLVVDIIVIAGSLVAVLDYFGIKPKPAAGDASMPNRSWKLAIMLALVALSLGLTGYAFYRSLRPRVVEKPVEKIVEKLVPQECPKCPTAAIDSHSKKTGKIVPEQPTPAQNQSGHDNTQTGAITQGAGSALSFGQQGGVTAGTINLGKPQRTISNPQLLIETLSGAPPREVTDISIIGGALNQDGYRLAAQMRDVLGKSGWKLPKLTNALMTNGMWPDVVLIIHGEPISVPSGPPRALGLGNNDPIIIFALALKNSGLNVIVNRSPDIPEDGIKVTIGSPN